MLTLAFMFEEPAFSFDTATIAGKRTVGSDYSVTRNDNAYRIRTIG